MHSPFLSTLSAMMLAVPTCALPPCDGGTGGPGTDASVPTDAGHGGSCPSTALTPGTTYPEGGANALYEITIGGQERSFKVHVPANYAASTPAPLVFVIHGLTQGAAQFVRGTDLVEVSDASGFVAVYPNGKNSSWNAGACCSDNAEDDVAFFLAMIDYVRDELGLCIDPARVYATGFSNGGMMSYRLACEASGVFAAVASVAGALEIDAIECAQTQTRHVPLLEIHGSGDPIVAYDDATTGVDAYASLSGCGESTHPSSRPSGVIDTTCVSRDGCPAGMELTLCTVEGGGHCWYGNQTCGTGVPGGQLFVGDNAEGIVAAHAVWDFLSRFECPGCDP